VNKRAVLAMLVLCVAAATGSARADMFAYDPDAVQCGYEKDRNVAALSAQDIPAAFFRDLPRFPPLPQSATRAGDPIRLDFSRSKNFVGHVGGGGGVRILYDRPHRILAMCSVADSAESLIVVANVPPPTFAVAGADLSSVETTRGLHLGSSIDDVRRVYGPAPLVVFRPGHAGLGYARFTPVPGPKTPPTMSPFGIWTWFEIRGGRVVAIERSTGF